MKLLSRLDNVNEWVGRVVGFLMLAIIVIIAIEVVSRYVFNAPTVWVSDTSGFLAVVYTMLGGGYALLHGHHVRVDVLYERFSPKQRAILDLTIASALFLIFAIILLKVSIPMAIKAIVIHEVSPSGLFRAPLWPFKIMIPIGTLLIIFQWIINMVRDIDTVRHSRR